MKTVVFAYHNQGCDGINVLLQSGLSIEAIFTHPDDGNNTWFRSVAELAAQKSIPVFAPDNVNHPIWVERIAILAPEVIFSLGYKTYLQSDILALPPKGCYRIHNSLLPKFRGSNPLAEAILSGEKGTGITLYKMASTPYSGAIISQKKFRINDLDTTPTLLAKSARATVKLLEAALPEIQAGEALETIQDQDLASYCQKVTDSSREIDWRKSAVDVRNQVRAHTAPLPGAYSYINKTRCLFWRVSIVQFSGKKFAPGTIISTNPLIISCGKNAVQIEMAQPEKSIYMTGTQFSVEMNLVENLKFGPRLPSRKRRYQEKQVLIIGVNGFIGSALAERILEDEHYKVHGIDDRSNYIYHLLGEPCFNFQEGDFNIHRDWIEYHIKTSDIVIPLISMSTPVEFSDSALTIFNQEFEANLTIIRCCAKYGKRLVFPSIPTDNSPSNNPQKEVYCNCRKLLEQLIITYGLEQQLPYTIFRPINWLGPRLDSPQSASVGSSQSFAQLFFSLINGEPIKLIDGGKTTYCFTDVTEAIECLFRIIDNRYNNCNNKIMEIGNPANEASLTQLAELAVKHFEEHSLRSEFPPFAGYKAVESENYFGRAFQPPTPSSPDISKVESCVNWHPKAALEDTVEETVDYILRQAVKTGLN